MARPGGYCVTLVYPIPLLPSGPGGIFGLQLRSPPDQQAVARMAERVGFEPTVELPPHTLSKRAPSTTRTSLRSSGINSLPEGGDPLNRRLSRDCDVRSSLTSTIAGISSSFLAFSPPLPF